MPKGGKIPGTLYKFFWDVNPEKLDPARNYRYILERLMEYGDDEAFRWMIKTYSKQKIIEVVKNSRAVSEKTASFWSNMYGIPKKDLVCKKSFINLAR